MTDQERDIASLRFASAEDLENFSGRCEKINAFFATYGAKWIHDRCLAGTRVVTLNVGEFKAEAHDHWIMSFWRIEKDGQTIVSGDGVGYPVAILQAGETLMEHLAPLAATAEEALRA